MTDQSSAEADLLAEMKRSWAEYLQFYSRPGKEDRERWVVETFLNCLSVPFVPEELHSPPQQSKVDVEFRCAQFQVKEIPDPNLRRGDEIKDTYRRVMDAKTLQETVGPGFAYDVPPVVRGYDLVLEGAREQAHKEKYRASKESLDLLFYITRSRTSFVEQEDIKQDELASLGWRSVSCLIGNRAQVLYASDEAPAFLRLGP